MAKTDEFGNVDTKEVAVQKSIATEYYADIHHMVRYISKGGPDVAQAQKTVWTVDAEVDVWLKEGYKVISTHYLGENAEGYGLLYVLVRD